MTDIDKKEISNIINGIREMKKCAEDTNKKYIDKKILNFAKEAKKDYLGNKEYICDIIRKNPRLFFNLDNFKVSSGPCGRCDHLTALNGKSFVYGIGGYLWVSMTLTEFNVIHKEYDSITFKVSNLLIHDVMFSISNTSDKRYSTFCWDDVTADCYTRSLDMPKTANEWNNLYSVAVRTRAKNEYTVKEFKDVLTNIKENYRLIANNNTKVKDNLKDVVGVYEKVDL